MSFTKITHYDGDTYTAEKVNRLENALDEVYNNNIYNCRGQIFTGLDSNSKECIVGVGYATVLIIGRRAIIDFACYITSVTGSATSSNTNYGITSALLQTLNTSLPTITAETGGFATVYTDNTLDEEMNGYGCHISTSGDYWRLARVTDASGSYAVWPASAIKTGQYITGRCFGTVAS